MRDVLRGGLGIAAALVLHSLMSRTVSSWTPLFHVFLLVVLFFAQTRGELAGALMGTCCGLVVDTLSLGIFGIAGLSLTITGFIAGVVARRINVLSFFKNFVFLLVMTSLELILWTLLAAGLVGQPLTGLPILLAARPPATAAVGVLIFSLYQRNRRRRGK